MITCSKVSVKQSGIGSEVAGVCVTNFCPASYNDVIPDTLSEDFKWGAAQDITKRKRAEEKLNESEARYRMLFENANDPEIAHHGVFEPGVHFIRKPFSFPDLA